MYIKKVRYRHKFFIGHNLIIGIVLIWYPVIANLLPFLSILTHSPQVFANHVTSTPYNNGNKFLKKNKQTGIH